jgi:hypothetical protein
MAEKPAEKPESEIIMGGIAPPENSSFPLELQCLVKQSSYWDYPTMISSGYYIPGYHVCTTSHMQCIGNLLSDITAL